MTDPGNDLPTNLDDAARLEQVNLWADLDRAIRSALNGVWSMQCDNLTRRITNLAHFVGATPWDQIDVSLTLAGVYERVLTEAGIDYPPVDWDAVARTEVAIADGPGRGVGR
jgi:hypothetical protein